MTTCKTTEGSTRQPGKPGIYELTEFKTNSKIEFAFEIAKVLDLFNPLVPGDIFSRIS